MTITLYEQEGCPFCIKVRERLDELDIDFESEWVSRRHSERAAVKEISGQRQVPVLVDEERAITMPESARILEYLNTQYAEAELGAEASD